MRISPAAWWPFAAWSIVIFLSSNRPIDRDALHDRVTAFLPERLREPFGAAWYRMWFYVVKGCHFAAYAVLMRFAYDAIRASTDADETAVLLRSAAICILNSIGDELHQTRVPGRRGALMDVLIDAGGITLTALLLRKRR